MAAICDRVAGWMDWVLLEVILVNRYTNWSFSFFHLLYWLLVCVFLSLAVSTDKLLSRGPANPVSISTQEINAVLSLAPISILLCVLNPFRSFPRPLSHLNSQSRVYSILHALFYAYVPSNVTFRRSLWYHPSLFFHTASLNKLASPYGSSISYPIKDLFTLKRMNRVPGLPQHKRETYDRVGTSSKSTSPFSLAYLLYGW